MSSRSGSVVGEWRNWSGEQRVRPVRIERPASTGAVASVVRCAAEQGLTVKAIGSGHSFTDIALSTGVLVDLGAMCGLVDADVLTRRVRVQAGITIAALNDELARIGLGMQNLGDVDVQTIAGAIATGTHGTGATLGNIPSQVVALQLVDGVGDVHELDEASDPDGWRAARVALGALGIVTEVTLQCVPAYVLRGVDRTEPLAQVLAELEDRIAAHRHFELYAFPYADQALTRTNDVVDVAPAPPGRVSRFVRQQLLETWTLRGTCEIGRVVPRAIPALNRTVSRLAGTSVSTDRSDRIFASPRHVPFVETEFALPRAAAVPVLQEILDTIRARRLPVNFPLEMRFVAGDDALLSPAHERDTAYLAAHVFRDMDWGAYFTTFEAIALRHGGRPHWGKHHTTTAAVLRERYPRWDDFAAVRARLDPHGRFDNAHSRRVLGPLPGAARTPDAAPSR